MFNEKESFELLHTWMQGAKIAKTSTDLDSST